MADRLPQGWLTGSQHPAQSLANTATPFVRARPGLGSLWGPPVLPATGCAVPSPPTLALNQLHFAVPLRRSRVLPGMVIREADSLFSLAEGKRREEGTTGEPQGALGGVAGPERPAVAPSQPQRKLLPVLSPGDTGTESGPRSRLIPPVCGTECRGSTPWAL